MCLPPCPGSTCLVTVSYMLCCIGTDVNSTSVFAMNEDRLRKAARYHKTFDAGYLDVDTA